jgi:adenylyltransferase/sulfurtransferase
MLVKEIGEEGQKKLLTSKVAIIGGGAIGSYVANLIARMGVRYLKIVDRDIVEEENMNSQIMFKEEDVKNKIPKAIAIKKSLEEINPQIKVEALVCDFNYQNGKKIVENVDLVIEGLDNMETRFVVNEVCVENGIPWIYNGVIGVVGVTMSIIPKKTPCLQCLIPQLPMPGELPTCDTVGMLNTVIGVVVGLGVTNGIKILLDKYTSKGEIMFVDVWGKVFEKIKVKRKKDCFICGEGRVKKKEKNRVVKITSMCGRNMVQILPKEEKKVSLKELKERLSQIGEVSFKGYLLVCKVKNYELLIFPDMRVLIKGTNDEKEGEKIYTKYIGM